MCVWVRESIREPILVGVVCVWVMMREFVGDGRSWYGWVMSVNTLNHFMDVCRWIAGVVRGGSRCLFQVVFATWSWFIYVGKVCFYGAWLVMLGIQVSLSSTFARNEKVEHYIRIKTQKFIVLRFWVESSVNALCGWAQVSLVLYLPDDILCRPNNFFLIWQKL